MLKSKFKVYHLILSVIIIMPLLLLLISPQYCYIPLDGLISFLLSTHELGAGQALDFSLCCSFSCWFCSWCTLRCCSCSALRCCFCWFCCCGCSSFRFCCWLSGCNYSCYNIILSWEFESLQLVCRDGPFCKIPSSGWSIEFMFELWSFAKWTLNAHGLFSMWGEVIMLVPFVCSLEVPVFWESKLTTMIHRFVSLFFLLGSGVCGSPWHFFFYESDNISFNHSAHFLKKTGGVWILT